MHNNFVTDAQARSHNLLYRGDLSATRSNVFETDPANLDLVRLSAELGEIAAAAWPFPVRIQPHRVALDDLITYYRRPEVFVGRRCADAFRMLMIDSDGEAIPVHGRCYRFPIGNVGAMSLKEIWSHEKSAMLRRALSEAGGLLPACSRCCSGFGAADKSIDPPPSPRVAELSKAAAGS